MSFIVFTHTGLGIFRSQQLFPLRIALGDHHLVSICVQLEIWIKKDALFFARTYIRTLILDMKELSNLRILLVQIRRDPSVVPSERRDFLECSHLSEEQLETLDVFRRPDFSPHIIDDYDAMMIGGLSDDDSDQIALPSFFNPILEPMFSLMQRAIEKKIPSLLSCGGFMLASDLVGARVIIDPDQSELGVYPISLTQDAQSDILLRSLPSTFEAVSGHIKSTIDLPDHCVSLAFSQRCQIHGFKVVNAPFYAFQFHPEITCENLKARIEAYKDKYFTNDEAYQAFINMSFNTENCQ